MNSTIEAPEHIRWMQLDVEPFTAEELAAIDRYETETGVALGRRLSEKRVTVVPRTDKRRRGFGDVVLGQKTGHTR